MSRYTLRSLLAISTSAFAISLSCLFGSVSLAQENAPGEEVEQAKY